MVAREAFEKAGPFNDRYGASKTGTGCCDMLSMGRCLFIPQPLAHIHLGSTIDAYARGSRSCTASDLLYQRRAFASASEKRRLSHDDSLRVLS